MHQSKILQLCLQKKQGAYNNYVPIKNGSQGIEHIVSQTNEMFDYHAKETINSK